MTMVRCYVVWHVKSVSLHPKQGPTQLLRLPMCSYSCSPPRCYGSSSKEPLESRFLALDKPLSSLFAGLRKRRH